jgi:outer membrane protein OmpA-like peptidoglycan-associated protein
MARLNQLSHLGIPFNFSLNTQRTSPSVALSTKEKQRTQTDTVYVESQPSEVLFNNKVDIYFDINQSQPSEQEFSKLDKISRSLEDNPNWSLYITGFADNTGNLQYNLNLIDRRMEQIQSYFVKEKGISPDRIMLSSGGLIIRGNGKKSSPMDRKVEVWIQENEE